MKKIYCVYYSVNDFEKDVDNWFYRSISIVDAHNVAHDVFIKKGKVPHVAEIDVSNDVFYSFKALLYAEKFGVIEYHTKGNEMIFYTSFPTEKTTYKSIVNLDTLTEKRHAMKYYYKPYKSMIGAKYTSNYMV